MELTDSIVPHKKKYGEATFTAAAGKSLVIETSPGGEEILKAQVPAGKAWGIEVTVQIIETDA